MLDRNSLAASRRETVLNKHQPRLAAEIVACRDALPEDNEVRATTVDPRSGYHTAGYLFNTLATLAGALPDDSPRGHSARALIEDLEAEIAAPIPAPSFTTTEVAPGVYHHTAA